MGMDRGIHVVVDDKDYANLQPLAVAKLLAKVAEEEKADIVIVGKQVFSFFKLFITLHLHYYYNSRCLSNNLF